MNSSLFNNSLLTFLRQVFSIGLGFLTVIIIARVLGVKGQGAYTFLTLIPISAQTLLSLGIPFATVYYIGKNKYNIESIVSTNIISSVIIGFFALLVSFIFIANFTNEIINITPPYLLMMALASVLSLNINKNILSIFQGLEDFKTFNFLAVLNQLLLLVLIALFLLILNLGLPGAIYSFFIANLTISIISIIILTKKKFTLLKFNSAYFKDSITFGLKGHVSNVVTFFNYRIDLFLIAYFLDSINIGIYSIAVTIIEKIWIVSSSVSAVIYSRLAHIEEVERRGRLTAKVGRIVLLVSVILGLILAGFFYLFIPLLFGEAYVDSIKPLFILLPGVLLMSISRIFSNYFTANGNPELNTYIATFVSVLNIILNVILIPKYGIIGAAWSTTISYCINMLIRLIIFYQHSKIPLLEILIFQVEDYKFFRNYFFDLYRMYNPIKGI